MPEVHCHWEDKPLLHKLFFIVQMRQSFKFFCKFEEVKNQKNGRLDSGEVCLLFFPSKGAH
jgi:hypothetical protein